MNFKLANSLLNIVILSMITSRVGVAQNIKVKSLDGKCFLIEQKCKLNVRQTKFGFTFGGIDFGTNFPVQKAGQVSLNTELIQKLTEIAQILDQMQLSRCQSLNVVDSCSAARDKMLVIQAVCAEQLGELAILAQMYSGNADKLQDAFLKWIVFSSDLTQKIYAKQFLGANPKAASDQKTARSALEYAIGLLHISANQGDISNQIRDPLRSQLTQ